MGEHTALEGGTELALHEAGDGVMVLAGSGEEGLEVLANGLVQQRLLRAAGRVGKRCLTRVGPR